ncbi:MAG: SDR family oxidoreductase [Acidimicrobiaceae bacterium]|nr:SDR family oxidoreductase [Acidimicrobiaceae bacterium]
MAQAAAAEAGIEEADPERAGLNVGVIGATGYVGGRLVPALLAAGHRVRCLARTPDRLGRVPWRAEVEVARADVLDRASLCQALAGLDAVYYLVHAMGHTEDFERTDRTGALNTRIAAEHAGVGRLVYLGGLGGDDPSTLSHHLASRHEVGRILGSGTVPLTELRAAVIIGSGSASFEMLRCLVEVLPVMVCPRWVTRTRCQPIAIVDVLHCLVAVLDSPAGGSQLIEVGGPDALTYQQMMERYAAVAGLRRRLILGVPVLTPRLSSHWVNLVTPLPIGLARPLVDSLRNDVVVSDPDPLAALLGSHRRMGFDEAVRSALAHVQDLDVSTSWIDSAPAGTPASPMPHDPHWAGGTVLEDVRTATTGASPEAVFAAVAGVGGDRGWYFANRLWAARGWVDKLLGGVGMRRGRRHPDELRVGDALDFFRVEVHEPPRLLRLRAEMRLPGQAWLEWQVWANDDGTATLSQRARFHPRGISGRAYWWLLAVPHAIIWRRLIAGLVRAAEARPASPCRPLKLVS